MEMDCALLPSPELEEMLREGWVPFGITDEEDGSVVHLRRSWWGRLWGARWFRAQCPDSPGTTGYGGGTGEGNDVPITFKPPL